jgi:hypothetical protein
MMLEKELKGELLALSKIQEHEQDNLLNKENVVGVALGHKIKDEKETGDNSLTVFVEQKMDPALLPEDNLIPATVGNFKTDVVETGPIFAGTQMMERSSEAASEEAGILTLKRRMRPAEGGFSVGHVNITAGTMATAVYDSRPFPGIPRKYYMLSNNHVLADSNNAALGDPIVQPGPFDGGVLPSDLIARLSRFVPIRFDGKCNLVDAAIAEGEFHDLDREIYWIGYVKGIASVEIGTLVQKTGRTTSYTTGRVTAINATVNVNYGGGKVAKMCRQIVTTNMSAGGDSGSLLLDMKENAVGLLFAGSPFVTIHNNIFFVQALLGIRIV